MAMGHPDIIAMSANVGHRQDALGSGATLFLQKSKKLVNHFYKLRDKNIIVVDDDEDYLRSLGMLLEGDNTVHLFPSAETALAEIKALNPDTVITDIGMPGMDGLTFIKALTDLYSE